MAETIEARSELSLLIAGTSELDRTVEAESPLVGNTEEDSTIQRTIELGSALELE